MHHYFFLVAVSPILHWFIDHLFLANNDNGVTIDEVVATLQSQRYFENKMEVGQAVAQLCNEGAIYSTIDDEHFKYVE